MTVPVYGRGLPRRGLFASALFLASPAAAPFHAVYVRLPAPPEGRIWVCVDKVVWAQLQGDAWALAAMSERTAQAADGPFTTAKAKADHKLSRRVAASRRMA